MRLRTRGKRQVCLLLALSFIFSLMIAGFGPAKDTAEAATQGWMNGLNANMVNVVSWDEDLHNSIRVATKIYPELESKINYINMGISNNDTLPYLEQVLNGKYNGYTIIFAADYANVPKYIRKADAISKTGFKESDYSNAYKYVKDLGSVNGELRAVSWNLCPGNFYYNVSIAKEVLGTSDPDKVQEMISTPAKFNDVAKKMKAKGYYMSTAVNKTSVSYDPDAGYPKFCFFQLQELLKTYDYKSYDTGSYIWNDGWFQDFKNGKVFCFYGTIWMKSLLWGNGVEDGKYAVCEGPVSFNWGGTFLFAKDLGNQGAAAAKLLTALTCDEKVMTAIAKEKNDFVNNKAVNKKLAADSSMGDVFFAGKQNAYGMWHNEALKLGGESEAGGGSSAGKSGWVKDNGKWKYYRADGTQVKSAWQKISGKWYYFDSKGYMVNGWQKINKKWYYFKNGVMQNGWKKISGKWYYFKNGEMKTGWLKISGKWYYFNSDGSMVTGSKKIGGKTYKFDSSGVCQNP